MHRLTRHRLLAFIAASLLAVVIGVIVQNLPGGSGPGKFIVQGSQINEQGLLTGAPPPSPAFRCRILWPGLLFAFGAGALLIAAIEGVAAAGLKASNPDRSRTIERARLVGEVIVILLTSFVVFVCASDPLRNAFY